MTSPFASAWRKFNWANMHAESLKQDYARVGQAGRERLPVDVDVKWEGHVLFGPGWIETTPGAYLRVSKPTLMEKGTALVTLGAGIPRLSDEFPLILGDSIQNYRAALDHLIWSLVRGFGAKLTTKQARQVQLPIHNSAADFERRKGDRTPGLPDKPHRAILKRYQPYRRGYGPTAIRWLRTLSDSDKHRLIPVAFIAPDSGSFEFEVSQGMGVAGPQALILKPTPAEPGTPIVKAAVLAMPGLRKREVKVDVHLNMRPIVRKRLDPLGACNLIAAVVGEIIASFETLA